MLYLESPQEETWHQFLAGGQVDVPDALHRSWSRSLAAGVHWRSPRASLKPPLLDGSEARLRQEAGERGWRHAKPLLEQLSGQLADNGFLGVWADPQGVILHRRGGGQFLNTAQRVELLEGADWNESVRGTNAIGTALREGTEVAVLGRAHLQRANHGLVCYAAPVFSPQGELSGVLDVTSHLATAQNLALAAVLAARVTIEQDMKFQAYNEALHGGLDSLEQLMESCRSPALLIERDGTLRALNTRARALFGPGKPPSQAGWEWPRLMTLMDSRTTVELVDHRGNTKAWRPIVEPIGAPDRPIAALIRLEPGAQAAAKASQSRPSRSCQALKGLYCADPLMSETLDKVAKLAPTDLPILLLAETGTGKERIARGLHQLSRCARGPFVPVNCGALTESLLESELFGYGPGAFTGAQPKGARGKIDMAHGGTLFLDEVADMSSGAQTRLLRVLEDGSYYRVGESIERRANVRVIAATCRPIEKMVRDNRMRADLYYRLKGATLTLPPLRDRRDIRSLAKRLIRDLSADLKRTEPAMTRGFIHALQNHDWPGNVRELKNALHVALVLSEEAHLLRPEHLPDDISRATNPRQGDQRQANLRQANLRQTNLQQTALQWAARRPQHRDRSQSAVRLLDQAQADALRQALERANNMSEAARILGVARSTLYRMLKKHDLF